MPWILSDSSGYPRCRPVDLAQPDQVARRGQRLDGLSPVMPRLPPPRGLVALVEVVGMAPGAHLASLADGPADHQNAAARYGWPAHGGPAGVPRACEGLGSRRTGVTVWGCGARRSPDCGQAPWSWLGRQLCLAAVRLQPKETRKHHARDAAAASASGTTS
jgi:hypothetical protein